MRKQQEGLPPSVRRELERRIADAEQQLSDLGIDAEAAVARIGGVKSGVSGVKNGVNLDAVGCNQMTVNVEKSSQLRLERWPSGRRRTPAKRVWG